MLDKIKALKDAAIVARHIQWVGLKINFVSFGPFQVILPFQFSQNEDFSLESDS